MRRLTNCTASLLYHIVSDQRMCVTGPSPLVPSDCRTKNDQSGFQRSTSSSSLSPLHSSMENFSRVMRASPKAVIQHRELMESIAAGDAESSKDLAGLLAETVRQVLEKLTIHPTCDKVLQDASDPISEKIPFSMESVGYAAEKASSMTGIHHEDTTDRIGSVEKTQSVFWESSEPLRMVIIDSNFELEENEDAKGEADEKALAVIDQFLKTDENRWKIQKRTIAAVMLDAAKFAGISPSLIHVLGVPVSDSSTFNPFKQCNIVVRCDTPYVNLNTSKEHKDTIINHRLSLLKNQIEKAREGSWTKETEMLARKEMEMSFSIMRYQVGLHKSITKLLGNKGDVFVREAMRVLNDAPSAHVACLPGSASSLDIQSTRTPEEREALSRPVVPYPYMLRLCLWYELPNDL